MATTKKLMGTTAAASGAGLVIEDVFSTYLYTGNSSTQTITNGIDLAGEGGLVWIKSRANAYSHNLQDTERGYNKFLNTTNTQAQSTGFGEFASFNSDGFSLGPVTVYNGWNTSGDTYASWTFRKAPRFFDMVTYTGTGSARTVSHDLGVEPGCIIVKRTDVSANWTVYHRGVAADAETDYLVLNSTAAAADLSAIWNDTAPTDSVFTVGTDATVNASGATYVAYLFAHDPLGPSGDGSDGLIACGSFTGGSSVAVDLGWEPQWVMLKRTDSSIGGSWYMYDTMRGFTSNTGTNGDSNYIFADSSATEALGGNRIQLKSYGFDSTANLFSGGNYIYIAIRRGPMRQPTSGTEVYQAAYKRTALPVFLSGFPVDMAIQSDVSGGDHNVSDRLRGNTSVKTNDTSAESAQTYQKFDYMDGYFSWTVSYPNYFAHMFRRAPGFFDVVAYTGSTQDTVVLDGITWRQQPHNLGVAPEMIIVKCRSTTYNWWVFHKDLPDYNTNNRHVLQLNSSNASIASSTFGGDSTSSSTPNADYWYMPTGTQVNLANNTFIAYLFASVDGVSKVGSYTGNGSSQTIGCGFTSGARFVLIKRTDSTGDWYIWDTARGIVAANDPHLSLNTTAAEVTTDDSIDPDNSGFIVNQNTATNINVSSASYIFYAVS